MAEDARSAAWLRRARIFFRELGWLIGQVAMYLFRALRSLIGWIRVRWFKGSASVESERRHERSTGWRALSPLRRAAVRAAVLLLCAVAILFAARRVERPVSKLGADHPQAAASDPVESWIERSAQGGAIESEQTANGTRTIASPTATPTDLGNWKIDNAPTLTPGVLGDWDDFAIASASVSRLPDKWFMLYEGVALTEDGKTHAFGAAESADGVKWQKRSENPVFIPSEHEGEIATAPSLTRWRDHWIAVYVVDRSLAATEKAEELKLPEQGMRLARSTDGLNWEVVRDIKGISFKPTTHALTRPCIYFHQETLHLWWIALKDDEPALFHSISQEGENWSKPVPQSTKEVDPRPMACARIEPSGDQHILTYVAFDEEKGPRLVTKTSQNARNWTNAEPSEFPLPAWFKWSARWQQAAPVVIFGKEGARLYYVDLLFAQKTEKPHPRNDAVRGAVLRTAFWPKQNVQK